MIKGQRSEPLATGHSSPQGGCRNPDTKEHPGKVAGERSEQLLPVSPPRKGGGEAPAPLRCCGGGLNKGAAPCSAAAAHLSGSCTAGRKTNTRVQTSWKQTELGITQKSKAGRALWSVREPQGRELGRAGQIRPPLCGSCLPALQQSSVWGRHVLGRGPRRNRGAADSDSGGGGAARQRGSPPARAALSSFCGPPLKPTERGGKAGFGLFQAGPARCFGALDGQVKGRESRPRSWAGARSSPTARPTLQWAPLRRPLPSSGLHARPGHLRTSAAARVAALGESSTAEG
ncbi:uncharacterized protein LOC128334495 [Hemicordylus capensis]|uniref:uncharacterized protein LOC128334495 n=1 Tax=Hemicordylus capensis TaxID=884348 RepID=UPI0023023DEB|nr:uncharacterized protein LOC128334495 [Hemicordylus capensis]